MKTIVIVSALSFIIGNATAQKIKETEVPVQVKTTFEKKYPAVKAKSWEKENGNYEAEFDLNKTEMSVLIDPTGAIVETEIEINVSELSKSIVDYCSAHYPGQKIAEASKIVDAKGVVTYEAEINKMDVLFDANGKFIKEAKD